MDKYDFLIVGAGLFGSVCARELTDKGYDCLIIDKNYYVGGNCSDELIENTRCCRHGPHIFHTSNESVWNYINRFTSFNQYIHNVLAISNTNIYQLPINLFTLHQIFGTTTIADAKRALENDRIRSKEIISLQDYALSTIGQKLFELLIQGYTEKQWGMSCDELPAEILKRIPIRLNYNNSYYDSKYQGMPIGGYTLMFNRLLDGVDVELNTDFFDIEWEKLANKVIYTGSIDKLFDYKYGKLPYRSLVLETRFVGRNTFINAQVNFTDHSSPFTRHIEHQYFYPEELDKNRTVISTEQPIEYDGTNIPYYPIPIRQNLEMYEYYQNEIENYPNIIIGGRLGSYKYIDMDQVIASALDITSKIPPAPI